MPRRPVRPRPVRPRFASGGEWAPLASPPAGDGSGAAGAATPPLTLSARTAAEAAHGVFQDALRDLGRWPTAADGAGGEEEHMAGNPVLLPETALDPWVEGGGPLGRVDVGGHRLSPADRDAGDARASARDRLHECVYAAAGAYARALRREGVGLPAALLAVRATVTDDVARLPAAAHAAVQRDAARCCLEAFYAH